MKVFLFLGVLLLSASSSYANTSESFNGSTWNSGNAKLTSGAMVTWKIFDSRSGNIYLAFLIPSKTNLLLDGVPQWSIGVANCKNGHRKFDYIFDTNKPFTVEEKTREAFDLTNDFCNEYFNSFSDSDYYKPQSIK